MIETVTKALAKTNSKVTKCHAVLNDMGMRKGFHSFHFNLAPMTMGGPNPFMLFPELKTDPPRTQDGIPLDISLSKSFCTHFKLCNKCLKSNVENEGACTCDSAPPRGGPSAESKKRDRDAMFNRMMAKMQRR